MSTTVDLTNIVQPVLTICGIVITALIPIYVPRAIAAFQARTGVVLTENQRQTVLDAVKTGAGVLETKLDQHAIAVEHIQIGSAAVAAQAQAVIDAVPVAIAALDLHPEDVARMIVGKVDTAAHGTVGVPA